MHSLFGTLPPPELLSPAAAKLMTELREHQTRLLNAQATVKALDAPSLDHDAEVADVAARAAAVRAGKSAVTVGSPAAVDLDLRRKASALEVEALTTTIANIEAELAAAVVAMDDDDRVSGRTALDAAAKKYVKAIDALDAARNEWARAAGLVGFVRRAVDGPAPIAFLPHQERIALSTAHYIASPAGVTEVGLNVILRELKKEANA